MLKRQTVSDARRMEAVCYWAAQQAVSGVTINLLDIPKIYTHARRIYAEGVRGADLVAGIREYVETIRVDQ